MGGTTTCYNQNQNVVFFIDFVSSNRRSFLCGVWAPGERRNNLALRVHADIPGPRALLGNDRETPRQPGEKKRFLGEIQCFSNPMSPMTYIEDDGVIG